MKTQFFVEMTDTFGGEANYCWVNRFLVDATTLMGAVRKVAKETGCSVRKVMDCGDFARYDTQGACICFFVQWADEMSLEQYPNIKTL